jgi:TPR repeat protein
MLDPKRAVSLYENAWRDGLPIAAFALGHLYETGAPDGEHPFPPDTALAWAWYRQGADAGILARLPVSATAMSKLLAQRQTHQRQARCC